MLIRVHNLFWNYFVTHFSNCEYYEIFVSDIRTKKKNESYSFEARLKENLSLSLVVSRFKNK